MAFWAYMIHCRAGRFYTGQTDDLDRRMAEHQSGMVSGFTQARHPLELVWSESFPSRYEAFCAEQRIKGWTRRKKLALIRADWDEISRLAKKKGSASTSSARTDWLRRDALAGRRAAHGQSVDQQRWLPHPRGHALASLAANADAFIQP